RLRSRRSIRAVLGDELASAEQHRDRFAAVDPVAGYAFVAQLAHLEIAVVHVSDLELAASRGAQGADDIEHPLVVEVEARDREIAARLVRLLDDGADPLAVHHRDPIVRRLVDAREHEERTTRRRAEALDDRSDRAPEEV